MIGILNVNKPVGITSHDVVQHVRRLTDVRRVGHAGTLDPLATGVLVVLVGRAATRLARFLITSDKVYRATIRLGEITPTYDTESKVSATHAVNVNRADVVAILADFIGEIEQIPPMYSALKKDGVPLYTLARQGKTVEREARQVKIYNLQLTSWTPPEFTVIVHCSAGTYIRSLAHDVGQALGCGAHLRTLVRTRSGHFELEASHTPTTLQTLATQGKLNRALLPPKYAFVGKPNVQLTAEQAKKVHHGNTVYLEPVPEVDYLPAHDPEGRLIAILVPLPSNRWRPSLVLNREA